MIADPKSYNHPTRTTLLESDTAALAEALITLTQELWVVADRQFIMEKILAERGIDISEEIDCYEPDEEFQKELNEKGRVVSARILNAMAGISSDD